MFCDFLMLGLDKVRSKFGTTALHRHNEAQAVLILYFKDYLLMWKYINLVYKTGKLEIFGNQWIIEFKYKFKIISVYVHCTYIALHVFTQYVVNFAVCSLADFIKSIFTLQSKINCNTIFGVIKANIFTKKVGIGAF